MKKYFHAWNLVFEGLPRPFWKLLKFFPDIKFAWEELSEHDLLKKGFHPDDVHRFKKFRGAIDLNKELSRIEKQDIQILTIRDDKYPKQLRDLNKHLPPAVLYIKGKLPFEDKNFISIVGTRNNTDYGETVTKQIIQNLAATDTVIVSGMANGIDSIAHKHAIKCGLETIAVLGFGHNKIPYHNKKFAEKIIENGAVISEYPPSQEAKKFYFPLRNRIISGLSEATIVTEAGLPSGARITANYALDQGREVYAVPGNISYIKSKGTNKLLQESAAHPICEPDDILTGLKIKKKRDMINKFFTPDQQRVINALKNDKLTINELAAKLKFPMQKFQSIITELELEDSIKKNKAGRYYIL